MFLSFIIKFLFIKKLSQIFPLSNTKQLCIDNAQFNKVDMDNGEDEIYWFWNKSINETESDLEDERKSDVEEPSLDLVLLITKKTVSL